MKAKIARFLRTPGLLFVQGTYRVYMNVYIIYDPLNNIAVLINSENDAFVMAINPSFEQIQHIYSDGKLGGA